MIRLIGRDGFEVCVDPERITAFGIEAPIPTLWVRIDGREFSFTENVQAQYSLLKNALHQEEGKIAGITP